MEIRIQDGATTKNNDNYGQGVLASSTSKPKLIQGTGNPNNTLSTENVAPQEMDRYNEYSKNESTTYDLVA